ncbi:MAG: MmcQ/YjbR family DNA-binding protein [Ignavibacteriaceae bacterium]
MDLETIREYCLKKKGVTESLPFDEDTPVYKVMGKIFLLANINPPVSINIKCDPEKAVELREHYSSVTPGYHMNKSHWNTILLENSISNKFILEWIDDSYNLIAGGLKKSEKEKLSKLK